MLLGGELAGGESFPWWRDGLVVRDDRLIHSRASETRARVKITLHEKRRHAAWGDFNARSRFARSIIPEEKWGTTLSLFSPRLLPFTSTAEPGPRLS